MPLLLHVGHVWGGDWENPGPRGAPRVGRIRLREAWPQGLHGDSSELWVVVTFPLGTAGLVLEQSIMESVEWKFNLVGFLKK